MFKLLKSSLGVALVSGMLMAAANAQNVTFGSGTTVSGPGFSAGHGTQVGGEVKNGKLSVGGATGTEFKVPGVSVGHTTAGGIAGVKVPGM
jgi:hypothetical protein